MHHWTDRKIRIHAFLLHVGHLPAAVCAPAAQAAWPICPGTADRGTGADQAFVLLYPPQGEKGPPRTAYVLSQQTLAQQALVKTLGLEPMPS